MRIDIMTDIETLGTNSDSTIIQVAAASFDISTGSIISTFNECADLTKNLRPLKVDASTLKWWLATDAALLEKILSSGQKSSEDILVGLCNWIDSFHEGNSPSVKEDIFLWGNGILFDNKMLQTQMQALGLQYPIFYRNDRAMRTIVDLASAKLQIDEKELKERYKNPELVAHDAFDDVRSQINLVSSCYRLLING